MVHRYSSIARLAVEASIPNEPLEAFLAVEAMTDAKNSISLANYLVRSFSLEVSPVPCVFGSSCQHALVTIQMSRCYQSLVQVEPTLTFSLYIVCCTNQVVSLLQVWYQRGSTRHQLDHHS